MAPFMVYCELSVPTASRFVAEEARHARALSTDQDLGAPAPRARRHVFTFAVAGRSLRRVMGRDRPIYSAAAGKLEARVGHRCQEYGVGALTEPGSRALALRGGPSSSSSGARHYSHLVSNGVFTFTASLSPSPSEASSSSSGSP